MIKQARQRLWGRGVAVFAAAALIMAVGPGLVSSDAHALTQAKELRDARAKEGLWVLICMAGTFELINLLTGEREEIPDPAGGSDLVGACHTAPNRHRVMLDGPEPEEA